MCAFYRDGGGFQATDEANQTLPEVYHMGIIDILTPYDMKKRLEHGFKSVTSNSVRAPRRARRKRPDRTTQHLIIFWGGGSAGP